MEDERKLFVSRLPDDIQDDEMNMIFNTYGNVVEVHILPGQKGPENLRSAFVLYDAADGAKAAIQVLDGIYKFRVDASEPIRVSIAKPRGSAKGKDAGKGKEKGGWDDGYGKGGKGNFGGYNGFPQRGGGYADRGYDDRGGYDRGYEKGEWGASRGYDRSQYADRGYDRGPEKGGYDRGYDQGYDRGGYAQPARASPYEKGCGGKSPAPWHGGRSDDREFGSANGPPPKRGLDSAKLYIGNLPGDITRDAVESVFSTYGNLEDVHVMNGRSKSGHSCAFVVYSTVDEAETAVAAMQTGYEIRPGEGNIVVKSAEAGKGKGKGGKGDRYAPY
jgi:RNA recognition motif-containing protein